MEKRILILFLLLTFKLTISSKAFVIKGTINAKLDNTKLVIYPLYSHPTDLIKFESECIIKGGKFKFEIKATTTELYVITLTTKLKKYSKIFHLAPTETVIDFITDDLEKYNLKGNQTHFEYQEFNNKLIALQKQDQKPFKLRWIEENITSVMAPFRLFGLVNEIDDDRLKRLYKLIPKENLKNSWGKELTHYVEKLSISAEAPIFSQKDLNGKMVNLVDYQGKYLLLDFWASWCVPCRAETPYLIKAREQFGKNGFEILSVSLDDNFKSWKEAIIKDKMVWDNLSDLRGWNNVVSKSLYKLHSIPANFLLDPSGKIISKNIRGTDIEKKLKEIFDSK